MFSGPTVPTKLSVLRIYVNSRERKIFFFIVTYDVCFKWEFPRSCLRTSVYLSMHCPYWILTACINVSTWKASKFKSRKKNTIYKCVKYVKIMWFCVEKVRIEALKEKIFNFNENNENYSVPECLWSRFASIYHWLIEFVCWNLTKIWTCAD
jgi:hypothetical protein